MFINSTIRSSKLYKAIFGYDIFISYSRIDSLDYAYSIAQYFLRKGFECYIDQLSSSTPGKELPVNIESAVKRSMAFILIGSNGSKSSIPIKKEIQSFLTKDKNQPLIPITIGNVISEECIWFSEINGLALITDSEENLKKGSPSNDILNRVEYALKFTKKSKRLKSIAVITALSVIFVTGIALTYTYYRIDHSFQEKVKADSLAYKQTLIAKKATEETKSVINEKDSIKFILDSENDRLNKEIAEKSIRLEQLTTLYTRQFKSAGEMYKEFGFAIEAVPFIKKYCQNKNLMIEKGELILFGKLEDDRVTVINAGNKDIISKFIEDWLSSTNKPNISIDGHYAGYIIDKESLDVTGKGTSEYNMRVSDIHCKSIVKYLKENGIPLNKIFYRSYGDTRNISKGILFNNRVEIYTTNH